MKVMILLCVVFILLQQANGLVKSLNANASTTCSGGCNWNNPDIWADGSIPTSADTVDIQIAGDFKIIVNVDVEIQSFEMGTNDYDDDFQFFEISQGVTFKSNGRVNTFVSTTTTVNVNGQLIATAKSLMQGPLIVYGTATFGGDSPNLEIDTYNTQPLLPKRVTGKLELQGGTVIAPRGIDISRESDIVGNGIVNTSLLTVRGTLRPGLGNVGTLYVNGGLKLEDNANVYIDLSSINTFDRVIIRDRFQQEGDLIANLINDYEPLSFSRFLVFNHSSQEGGFADVKGEGIKNIFSNKWQVLVDQSYTELEYNSALSLFVSLSALLACLSFSLL